MAEIPTRIPAMLALIDQQITLSDYGENTYSLNELYYELYLMVRRNQ
jgi:hypothetical protein